MRSCRCGSNTRYFQCKCRNEYVGLRCDRCTHGFFGFPNCQPCDCVPAGTDPLQCRDGLCLCNEEGECPCKVVSDRSPQPCGNRCDQFVSEERDRHEMRQVQGGHVQSGCVEPARLHQLLLLQSVRDLELLPRYRWLTVGNFRSSTCEQSSLLWQQTYAEDRRAVFEEPWDYYTKKHNLNLLKVRPWPLLPASI